MPSTGMPSDSLASMSGTLPETLFSWTGCSAASSNGPIADVVGQQHLPARHRDEGVDAISAIDR